MIITLNFKKNFLKNNKRWENKQVNLRPKYWLWFWYSYESKREREKIVYSKIFTVQGLGNRRQTQWLYTAHLVVGFNTYIDIFDKFGVGGVVGGLT